MPAMNWKQLISPHRVGSTEPVAITHDRSPFQRDFDRIVFSGALRRLQNKTQVFPLVKTDYVRTRLTHSLEASSIGRSLGTTTGVFICERFDTAGIHPSDIGAAVAAAALAHDIGNPPLGHAGEEAIRHWFTTSAVAAAMRRDLSPDQAADLDNYEGNAQGFRVLTHLEMPDQRGGMQLTCATLGAFAKYPAASRSAVRPFGVAGKKFNFFQPEKELFREVAEACGLLRVDDYAWQRHPLAYLVEAADDIAYLIVDFEDGQRLGLIDYAELEEAFLQLVDDGKVRSYLATLHSKTRKAEYLRAKVIGRLVQSAARVFIDRQDELLEGRLEHPLLDYLDCRDVLTAIRRRSIRSIYNHRSVAEVIAAGFEMVSGMLDIFMPCVNELAAEARGRGQASCRSRRLAAILPDFTGDSGDDSWKYDTYTRLMRVMDYVAGMTDSYAVSLYQKLKGISL